MERVVYRKGAKDNDSFRPGGWSACNLKILRDSVWYRMRSQSPPLSRLSYSNQREEFEALKSIVMNKGDMSANNCFKKAWCGCRDMFWDSDGEGSTRFPNIKGPKGLEKKNLYSKIDKINSSNTARASRKSLSPPRPLVHLTRIVLSTRSWAFILHLYH